MIKSNELRLGNLVSYHGKIETINRGFEIEDAESYEPIQLSEEWLLKLGFEKKDAEYRFGQLSLVKNGIGDWFNVYHQMLDNDFRILTSSYYVHQLQNLYFALTREDLTIKETV